jgi:hypothetical protein
MITYYDQENQPITDVREWAQRLEKNDRRIAQSTLWFGLVWISTVWLGIDHDWDWMAKHPDEANPAPLQFETMVFIRGNGGYMQRWRYREQAEAGHNVVKREMMNPIKLFKAWREYR